MNRMELYDPVIFTQQPEILTQSCMMTASIEMKSSESKRETVFLPPFGKGQWPL